MSAGTLTQMEESSLILSSADRSHRERSQTRSSHPLLRWSYHLLAPRSTEAAEARRETMTRRVLFSAGIVLAVLTVAAVAGWLLLSVWFVDVIVTAFADLLVAVLLFLAWHGVWRISAYVLPVFLLGLAIFETSLPGRWLPAPAYFSLAIVVTSMLLDRAERIIAYTVLLLAYPAVGALRGETDARQLVTAFVRTSAPLAGIIILLRFAMRRLEGEVAERQLAEESARGSASRLREVFETIGDAILVVNENLRILDCNETTVTLHAAGQKENLIGTSVLDLVAPRERDAIRARAQLALAEGRTGTVRLPLLKLDGTEFEGQIVARVFRGPEGKPAGFVIAGRDVTQQIGMEKQLRQEQKLQAVGRLAAGVAHDFNNLLFAIRGHAELALQDIGKGQSGEANVAEVLAASDRAATLVRQLLAFGRGEETHPQRLDLNTAIASFDGVVTNALGPGTRLVVSPSDHAAYAFVDPVQLEQLVMNLCLNARDAMPRGGELRMTIRNVVFRSEDIPANPWAREGRFIRLSVEDTGAGMSPEVREHLFEPFFTTKEQGEGMGLAAVYGIAQLHDGFIHHQSEPARGTRFFVYLPAAPEEG
ncbi:MAG TPA: ATP-binding protein [Spirochaetia bacterium]|nr:ATP-binding protein [Spirochaetia bacterium]